MTNISLISDHKLPQTILLTCFQLLSKNIKAVHPSSTKINNTIKTEYFVDLRKPKIIPLRLLHACAHTQLDIHTEGEWKRGF